MEETQEKKGNIPEVDFIEDNILNVLRKLDFLADILNYLIIYTYKII